ncbi:MAG: hypothetical protein Fues2KO_29480 [Fuerstiella sp.]
MCDFAVRLTVKPGASSEQDVDQLRRVGFSDEEILIATQVIGYFNYINRIADGLGVAPESWMPADPDQWRSEKADFRQAVSDQ